MLLRDLLPWGVITQVHGVLNGCVLMHLICLRLSHCWTHTERADRNRLKSYWGVFQKLPPPPFQAMSNISHPVQAHTVTNTHTRVLCTYFGVQKVIVKIKTNMQSFWNWCHMTRENKRKRTVVLVFVQNVENNQEGSGRKRLHCSVV